MVWGYLLNGWFNGIGSTSKTSRHAPDSFLFSKARIRSDSTRWPPLPTLIKKDASGKKIEKVCV